MNKNQRIKELRINLKKMKQIQNDFMFSGGTAEEIAVINKELWELCPGELEKSK